jgi:threonine/homoserine/homoserine lactone efflux protein
LFGGLFLFYLGVRTFFSKPAADKATSTNNSTEGSASAYFSTLFLTLTNPATIISFTVIFAGLGFTNTNGNYLAATFLVLGVFLGSSAWWLTLSSIVGVFHKRFSLAWMIWVNRLAGLIICAFGIATLIL